MSYTLPAPFAACCRFLGDVSDLADERAQSLRDRLVAVTRGVLVDHRRTDAGMPETCLSSLSVAPDAAERVPPVCRRS